jgi:aminoglycoside phosphotransferase (APT) family kinase protein
MSRAGRSSPSWKARPSEAATYNAAWHQGKLTGFFDWDFAGPATPEWDLALAAFNGIRDLAASGDEAFGRLLRQGVPDALDQAIAEPASFPR